MRQLISSIVMLFLIVSCNTSNFHTEEAGFHFGLHLVDIEQSDEKYIKSNSDSSLLDKGTLKCDNMHFWLGSLLGPLGKQDNQNFELYMFGQCISRYDVVWRMDMPFEERKKYHRSQNVTEFRKKGNNLFRDGYVTYVFKLPLLEVGSPAFEDPYQFPCEVEVLKGLNESERFVKMGKYEVNNFEEYVQLQYSFVFE